MSNLTTHNTGRLPTRAPAIVMPARLGYVADQVAVRGPSALPSEIEPGLRQDAEGLIPTLERMCEPASPDVIAQWMNLVALGVANTPDEKLREARIGMVVQTCRDLPRACWTQETRAEFARRGDGASFWPSDSEVDNFLRPIGARLQRQLRALRLIRDRGLEERRDDPEPVDEDEERANVAGLVQQAIANLRAGGERRERLFPDALPPARRPLPDVSLRGAALRQSRAARGCNVPVPLEPDETGEVVQWPGTAA